jgi:hypothetical protein
MYVRKSGIKLGLAQDGGLLGNLGGQEGQVSWPAGKLPVWQRGKRYLSEGILKENLEAAGASVKEVVLPTILLSFIEFYHLPNLISIKRQSNELYFSSIYSFKRSFPFTAFYLLIWSRIGIKP